MALAQAMARVQGLVTPIANVRWRTKMNLLQDLALGRDIKSFLLKGADESTSAALREAFNWFEGVDQFGVSRMQSIARLHVLAETSEYAFLKKAFSEKAFRTIADFAAQPDTIFSALTASLKIGQYVPGSTGPDSAETMVDRIQKYLGDLLDDAQGKNVEVWDQLVSPEIRAQILSKGGSSKDYVIRQMAEAFQAVSFLDQQGLKSSYESLTQWVVNQGDTAIDAAGIGQQWAKLMLGRSADFGNRLLTDASGWYGNVSNFIKESQAAAESGTAKLSQSLSGFSRKFLELVKEHPGKTAIGVGALAAYAIANSVGNSFSGADTDGMSGAPLPPSPLLRAGGSEPTIDFENHSMHEFARIERVPQVRTHAQISGQTGGVDFRGLSNRALYSRGRTPNHTGTFISDAGQMKDRARVEAEIRDRMNAEF